MIAEGVSYEYPVMGQREDEKWFKKIIRHMEISDMSKSGE